MREALFIKRNKDRWLRNQHLPSDDPDEMAKDFTQLLDDLAYAKTFYPSGKVTRFINTQASKIYLDIYRNRKEESNRLITFWKYDLPLIIRKHHGVILFSFVIFLIFFAIGFFTSQKDAGVAREFFGDGYVNKTIDNIEKGNPFGIYESGNAFLSWMGIMINNIKVSLIMFTSGLFCGIPTSCAEITKVATRNRSNIAPRFNKFRKEYVDNNNGTFFILPPRLIAFSFSGPARWDKR